MPLETHPPVSWALFWKVGAELPSLPPILVKRSVCIRLGAGSAPPALGGWASSRCLVYPLREAYRQSLPEKHSHTRALGLPGGWTP